MYLHSDSNWFNVTFSLVYPGEIDLFLENGSKDYKMNLDIGSKTMSILNN